MSNNLILAIESSCDETAISIVKSYKDDIEILSNEVSSQVKLHAKWGGVVPNLAAREHVKNIEPILTKALEKASIKVSDVDAIAVTNGPGLIPALLVGVNFAKTLAYLHNKPLIGIHHIEGHIYANFISNKISEISNDKFSNLPTGRQVSKEIPIRQPADKNQKKSPSLIENCELKIENSLNIKFPILCLVVSGGHTQLVLMKDHLKYEIIGQTLDDAVGEAFDKVARILNIGYPGGPKVAQWATKFQETKTKLQTNPNYKISNVQKNTYGIKFPRPMLNKQGYNFSFSGLKTAVLYETKKHPELLNDKEYIAEICHEFQQASTDVLIAKTLRAAKEYACKTIMIAGGVSANKELRTQLGESIKTNLPETSYVIPDLSLTGDNAAMIGAAAIFRWQKMNDSQRKKTLTNWKTLQTDANLKLK